MMNEELYIKSRMGNKNPFRVPEGYFDNLTAEVMKNLPQQEAVQQPQQSKLVKWKPWMYAAACMLVAVFTATIYFFAPDTANQHVADATPTASDDYVEEVADYVMADNIDIYACLASEY